MSSPLGVFSLASFRSLAAVARARFFFVCSAVLGLTTATRITSSTTPEIRIPSQKGLSFILFIVISLLIRIRGLLFAGPRLRRRQGRLAGLLADGHLQRYLVAPEVD